MAPYKSRSFSSDKLFYSEQNNFRPTSSVRVIVFGFDYLGTCSAPRVGWLPASAILDLRRRFCGHARPVGDHLPFFGGVPLVFRGLPRGRVLFLASRSSLLAARARPPSLPTFVTSTSVRFLAATIKTILCRPAIRMQFSLRHAEELKRNPSEWMAWNYRATLGRLATPSAA